MMQKLTIILLVALSLFIFSCDKAKDIIPVGNMEATVDGSSWKALTRVAIYESGYFNITGTSADGDIISILIMGDTEGSYTLDISITGGEAQVGGFFKPAAASNSDNYLITKATVVLTDVDTNNKKISGTFELEVTKTEGTTVIETLEITDGEFDSLKYTET